MTTPQQQKALCVATRCRTVDEFVATFHGFCDETSFFVATMSSRPVGLETAFSIQLDDKTPVLRGMCTVAEAWSTPDNRFGRPGLRLLVKRLTIESRDVFKQLQAVRLAADPNVPKVVIPLPKVRATTASPVVIPPAPVRAVPSVAGEERTPGSSYVLPANPLMNLTDGSLEGFVDCALYEETANFFRAAEDDGALVEIDALAEPPVPRTLAPRQALRVPAWLSPTAFSPPEEEEFVPEVTPLPVLARLPPVPPPRLQTDPVTMTSGRTPASPLVPYVEPVFTPAMSPPMESTASLLAMTGPPRRRWLVIGGASAAAGLLLLVISLASSGEGATVSAAPVPARPMPVPMASAPPVTAPAVTAPSSLPVAAPKPKPKPPSAIEAHASAAARAIEAPSAEDADAPPSEATDPNAPPVVGEGPCRLTVTSSPAGSIVHLDDQTYGPSPITIAGPCAKRRVDIKHPRYALGTRWVTLAAGAPATVDIALVRPTHTMMIKSDPPGATVSIAGKRAGTTPTAVKIMGFSNVTFTMEKRGYKTVSQKLYSKKSTDTLSVRLTRGR